MGPLSLDTLPLHPHSSLLLFQNWENISHVFPFGHFSLWPLPIHPPQPSLCQAPFLRSLITQDASFLQSIELTGSYIFISSSFFYYDALGSLKGKGCTFFPTPTMPNTEIDTMLGRCRMNQLTKSKWSRCQCIPSISSQKTCPLHLLLEKKPIHNKCSGFFYWNEDVQKHESGSCYTALKVN